MQVHYVNPQSIGLSPLALVGTPKYRIMIYATLNLSRGHAQDFHPRGVRATLTVTAQGGTQARKVVNTE
jgi:hypothetical protein